VEKEKVREGPFRGGGGVTRKVNTDNKTKKSVRKRAQKQRGEKTTSGRKDQSEETFKGRKTGGINAGWVRGKSRGKEKNRRKGGSTLRANDKLPEK